MTHTPTWLKQELLNASTAQEEWAGPAGDKGLECVFFWDTQAWRFQHVWSIRGLAQA